MNYFSRLINKIDHRIDEVLISSKQLKKGITKTAKWLNHHYANKVPVVIGILKGCIPFFGTIMPKLHFDFEIDFMSASSFKGGLVRQNNVNVELDIKIDIENRDVIILEDIIDTANTLSLIVELLKTRNPKSIKIVTLLDKKECRKNNLHADYSAFVIEDKFIVGFGLDYQEKMRNFNYIGCLKPEYIKKKEAQK